MSLINGVILDRRISCGQPVQSATQTKANRGFYKAVVQDVNEFCPLSTLYTLTHQTNISLQDP